MKRRSISEDPESKLIFEKETGGISVERNVANIIELIKPLIFARGHQSESRAIGVVQCLQEGLKAVELRLLQAYLESGPSESNNSSYATRLKEWDAQIDEAVVQLMFERIGRVLRAYIDSKPIAVKNYYLSNKMLQLIKKKNIS